MKFIFLKSNRLLKFNKIILSLGVLFFLVSKLEAQHSYPDIKKNNLGELIMVSDSLGNQIPDFSYAGYMSSEKKIPTIVAKIFVPKQQGDATAVIQSAIDYVTTLKPNSDGFKGAVLLDKGVFKINGTLNINNSGVVLRGSGTSKNGTILLGTGINRKAIIKIAGVDDMEYQDTLELTNKYIPLGSHKIVLTNTSRLKPQDKICIKLPLNDNWIKTLKMNSFGGESSWIGWKTKDWDITWNRTISSIDGNEIFLDAPLTMSLNSGYGKPTMLCYTWKGRIEKVGVENLSIHSTYDKSNPKDEQHRWIGITMEHVIDGWIRQVHFKHLAGGAVNLLKTAQRITVEDCIATDPVSEHAAFRRHMFYTEGQQTLFQRCYSEYGYHDFSVGGFGTTGPNAFVQCESFLPLNNSGTIGSWATGVLFDVVSIDGGALCYDNREQAGRGAGWTAANSVIWESNASSINNYSPPTAQNWAFGVWGGIMVGNGHWKDVNQHISPRSLFYAQLKNRLGTLPFKPHILALGSEPTSSPTIGQAKTLTQEALHSKKSLKEWIQEVARLKAIPVDTSHLKSAHELRTRKLTNSQNATKITIQNGWLTHNGKVLTGKRNHVMWWRGSLRNHDLAQATPHLTRFVPGKIGKGLTDNLEDVVQQMSLQKSIALEHNYGLWYERRMDDHERTRRIDADVWVPFYEQPFARSGKGQSWDHLSSYDLTKFNEWYWYRLKEFASLAEPKGQLLIQQHYFQHNILEAGAHWSSSPWRSANNVNNTGFPEPPPYAGDKRIFMAEQFYDISNNHRKQLHQRFIKKSFENFNGQSNVIHLTSAEYTGPLPFIQFWLDEAQKFKAKNSANGIIGLSATKDVQDAILNDSSRASTVDLIDIRYWHYRDDGSLYAPEGGKNLAPRQHARKMKKGKQTDIQVYRAVVEYRQKYPEKVIVYSADTSSKFGWPVLMAGGSLANIPQINIPNFYREVAQMKIAKPLGKPHQVWGLEKPGVSYLFYLWDYNPLITLNLSPYSGNYDIYWIDSKTGEVLSKNRVKGKQKHILKSTEINKRPIVVFIKKQ